MNKSIYTHVLNKWKYGNDIKKLNQYTYYCLFIRLIKQKPLAQQPKWTKAYSTFFVLLWVTAWLMQCVPSSAVVFSTKPINNNSSKN